MHSNTVQLELQYFLACLFAEVKCISQAGLTAATRPQGCSMPQLVVGGGGVARL